MKRDLIKKINIPNGVKAEGSGTKIMVKGIKGSLEKEFKIKKVKFEIKDEEVVLSAKGASKDVKRNMNSVAAHITNMIKGVDEGYEYELKVCASHFPITVEKKGVKAIIKNFLGEKVPREVTIPKGAEVIIDKDKIIISSIDKEIAGQASANFEKSTRVSNRDNRVFQDGIYIIKKPGREF